MRGFFSCLNRLVRVSGAPLDALDGRSPATFSCDANSTQGTGTVGRAEPPGTLRREPVVDLFEVHAYRGILNSCHADVSDIGSALEDHLVSGLHMCVGADHGRGTAPEVIPHHLLLRCRLGMEIDDERLPGCRPGYEVIGRPERVVVRLHEHPSNDLRDGDPLAVPCRVTGEAQPGRTRGVVQRANEPAALLQKLFRLLLVPGVVPHGHDIDPGVQHLFEMLAGDAETAGGDRKSTRLNSSHVASSYAVVCLKKKRAMYR